MNGDFDKEFESKSRINKNEFHGKTVNPIPKSRSLILRDDFHLHPDDSSR